MVLGAACILFVCVKNVELRRDERRDRGTQKLMRKELQTPFVVQDFVSRGLRVRYIRNTQNIGADANFLQCFEQALGKYVWLFSDDDLIVPGGLAKILTYC